MQVNIKPEYSSITWLDMKTINNYDYYEGITDDGKSVYNKVPSGSLPPSGGYYNGRGK